MEGREQLGSGSRRGGQFACRDPPLCPRLSPTRHGHDRHVAPVREHAALAQRPLGSRSHDMRHKFQAQTHAIEDREPGRDIPGDRHQRVRRRRGRHRRPLVLRASEVRAAAIREDRRLGRAAADEPVRLVEDRRVSEHRGTRAESRRDRLQQRVAVPERVHSGRRGRDRRRRRASVKMPCGSWLAWPAPERNFVLSSTSFASAISRANSCCALTQSSPVSIENWTQARAISTSADGWVRVGVSSLTSANSAS